MLLSDFLQNVNFIVTYLRKIALHVQILMQLGFLEIKSKKYASINNNNCLSALFSAGFKFCSLVSTITAPYFYVWTKQSSSFYINIIVVFLNY